MKEKESRQQTKELHYQKADQQDMGSDRKNSRGNQSNIQWYNKKEGKHQRLNWIKEGRE